MWSKGACKFCGHKKNSCKPDSVAGITKLSESLGVPHAIEHYGSENVMIDGVPHERARFDPREARKRAFARWAGPSESKGTRNE